VTRDEVRPRGLVLSRLNFFCLQATNMPWTTLLKRDELVEGLGRCVEVAGFELAVFLHQGVAYVSDNRCPHAGGSMSAGYIDDGCAVCPWHGWAFDLKDGALRGSPVAGLMLDVYQTRIATGPDGAEYVQADLPMP
jgi:nitrite reductase/ring-hydroxylating ferredoxin subunit